MENKDIIPITKKDLKQLNEVAQNEIKIKKDFSIEFLIEKAIEKNMPIETLEKLLTVRKELKEEFAKEEYFRALSKFQSECPEIIKDKKVYNKDGKTIRYFYASLDNIIKTAQKSLENNGFSYTFTPICTKNEIKVITSLHHVSGHSEIAEFTAEIGHSGFMSSIQEAGVSMSYAKRYSFSAVTGLMTTDEDQDGILPETEQKSETYQKNLANLNKLYPKQTESLKIGEKPIEPAQTTEKQKDEQETTKEQLETITVEKKLAGYNEYAEIMKTIADLNLNEKYVLYWLMKKEKYKNISGIEEIEQEDAGNILNALPKLAKKMKEEEIK